MMAIIVTWNNWISIY